MLEENLLALYEPKPGKFLDHPGQLWQARYSPCGKFIVACGYDGLLHRWNVEGEEFKPLPPLAGHNGWVQCMALTPQADLLFSADSWGQLACWAYKEETPRLVWSVAQAHPAWIRGLAVSPDGARVATCGNDSMVRIWSAADGKVTQELPEHPNKVFSVCFHPDGQSLISGDLKGVIRHWDLATGKVARQLDAAILYQLDKIQECGGARLLAFDEKGERLVVAGQKTPGGGFATGLPAVLVFDWAAGTQLQEMQIGVTDDGFVYDARFHPAGFVMATSCAFPGKGHVWFWKPGDEKAFFVSTTLPNGRSLSLHPDGRRLAMLVSIAANGNGRGNDAEYKDGTAKIQVLDFPQPPLAQT